MACHQVTKFVLNSGLQMPSIGVGTFGIKSLEVIELVLDTALACGYRLIDTASVYRNEHLIGQCLPQLLKKHGLKRDEVFITTKLSPRDLDAEKAPIAFEKSLNNLGLEYVDLYLIHWPGRQGKKVEDPINAKFRAEAWQALEKIHMESHKIRHLGVSNYTIRHLKEMSGYAKTVPAVLQSELHLDYLNAEVFDYCKQNSIHYQAYSSLGQGSLVADKRFEGFMQRFSKKTFAQVLLRWGLQQGCSVLPKSCNPVHIRENFDLNDFVLSTDDFDALHECCQGDTKKYAWDSVHVA